MAGVQVLRSLGIQCTATTATGSNFEEIQDLRPADFRRGELEVTSVGQLMRSSGLRVATRQQFVLRIEEFVGQASAPASFYGFSEACANGAAPPTMLHRVRKGAIEGTPHFLFPTT